MGSVDEDRVEIPLGRSLGIFVGLAGVSAAITVVFLGMRSVMDIGGFCPEAGPP
jgi:hypothetical protein